MRIELKIIKKGEENKSCKSLSGIKGIVVHHKKLVFQPSWFQKCCFMNLKDKIALDKKIHRQWHNFEKKICHSLQHFGEQKYFHFKSSAWLFNKQKSIVSLSELPNEILNILVGQEAAKLQEFKVGDVLPNMRYHQT